MAVDNGCYSRQTFCDLNRQTVQNNPDLRFYYGGCITAAEIVEDTTWNELIYAIQNVYNYGIRGTRNPVKPFSLNPDVTVSSSTEGNETGPTNRISNTSIQTKTKSYNNQINLSDYNAILSTIGATTLPNTSRPDNPPIIYGTYFKEVMDTLNNYQLNSTRCNNCNTGCNSQCQAYAQCCDSHCCTECCTDCCTDCCTTCHNSVSWCEVAGDSYGPCWATGDASYSAKIYKENINNYLTQAIPLIEQIKIVSFNYKDDPEKNLKIGFIADDTDSSFATEKHDRMDYYNCIGLLLKAVQELQAEINDLKQSK